MPNRPKYLNTHSHRCRCTKHHLDLTLASLTTPPARPCLPTSATHTKICRHFAPSLAPVLSVSHPHPSAPAPAPCRFILVPTSLVHLLCAYLVPCLLSLSYHPCPNKCAGPNPDGAIEWCMNSQLICFMPHSATWHLLASPACRTPHAPASKSEAHACMFILIPPVPWEPLTCLPARH